MANNPPLEVASLARILPPPTAGDITTDDERLSRNTYILGSRAAKVNFRDDNFLR